VQSLRNHDWLRAYRELLAREKAFTGIVERFCAGEIGEEEFKAARQLLLAQRELADAVTAKLEQGRGQTRPPHLAADADRQSP
jgi:IS5 family transposase